MERPGRAIQLVAALRHARRVIAVFNSLLVGAFVGLLVYVLWTLPLLACVSGGGLAFLLSIGLHQRYQWKRWRHLLQSHAALFPSRPGERNQGSPSKKEQYHEASWNQATHFAQDAKPSREAWVNYPTRSRHL